MNVQIVSFHCVLKNKMGRVLSSTYNREVLTCDETQQTLPGLAKGLRDLKPGEKRSIQVAADEAYGFYDKSKVREVPISRLKGRVRLGQKIRFKSAKHTDLYTVTHIDCDKVILDSNHPLAGQDLIFEIEATEVRDATPEDLRDSLTLNPSELLH